LKNELDTAQSQPTQGYFESISLRALLQQNLRTVLYNHVNNVYADTVEQWATKNNVVRLNVSDHFRPSFPCGATP